MSLPSVKTAANTTGMPRQVSQKLPPLSDRTVIRTTPEGRCFFRNDTIALHKYLQTLERDQKGKAEN